jgi:hypothetical protein
MSGYRLKKNLPEFQVTREGPFEYHTFRHGVVYERIPEEDRSKFEPVAREPERERGGGKKR